jgi:D-glucosaminate-6-phosphate ammonia-lyase
MDSYLGLPVEPVINAVGAATRFGGVALADEVREAMDAATLTPVRIDELQVAAGTRIADVLGVPGAYVTAGGSAALSMAAALLVQRHGRAKGPGSSRPGGWDKLCGVAGREGDGRAQIVIQATHYDTHDIAFAVAGAEVVRVGYQRDTHPDYIRAAVGPHTVGVASRTGSAWQVGAVDLATVADIAHSAGLLVIVDAAVTVPPIDNLHKLFADGADLVAVCGGKLFRGPQASGLLCAAPELLDEIALLHQDMGERDPTWRPPTFVRGATARRRELPAPRAGIARGMKVGREQIMGLVAAIERYVRSPGQDELPGIRELEEAEAALRTCDQLEVSKTVSVDTGLPIVTLRMRRSAIAPEELVRRLSLGRPRVVLGEGAAWRGDLTIAPNALLPGHGTQVADAVMRALAG